MKRCSAKYRSRLIAMPSCMYKWAKLDAWDGAW